jgi:hypothetical protein
MGSIMNNCLYCDKETKNPKFCSRSCAASYNNKIAPKRKPEHTCIDCNKPINSTRKRCLEHHLIWVKTREFKDLTLGEAIYRQQHRTSAYALVRTRARIIAKKLGYDKCKNCGYNKHVEIAHIKPISSFSEEILLSEINSIDNLLPLCPNCHWEFDNNIN